MPLIISHLKYKCIALNIRVFFVILPMFGLVLYTHNDLKLRSKSHGPTHLKIGVTCVYNGHVCYTLLY